METKCHTSGSISYRVKDTDGQTIVFTGDTLFLAGCGRFFEGSPMDMNHALNDVLAKLPKDTLVYCGHEYTLSNLRFAAHVEPNNQQIKVPPLKSSKSFYFYGRIESSMLNAFGRK